MTPLRHWLADQLVRAAAKRTRRRHPEWADAMLNEQASLGDTSDNIDWAFGLVRVSFGLDASLYLLLLAFSVAAMTLYQWSADESLITVTVIIALAAMLGCVRPSRFIVSGLSVGVVVASVNAFETLSGVRPAYETYEHTWMHDIRWLWLVLPALASSALGRRVGSLTLEQL